MGKDPEAIRQEINETRGRMTDTVEAIGYRTDVSQRTRDRVNHARESAQHTMDRIREKITGATPDPHQVQERAKQNAQKAAGIAQENPLGLALGSVALGFMAGIAAPPTKIEQEKFGPASQQFKEQARETGQEALEHGKQVAQETAQVAQETTGLGGDRTPGK